jgi:hypothetical protein
VGGAVAEQCVGAGLLDEILIHVAPVLLGKGIRLFERSGPRSTSGRSASAAPAGSPTSASPSSAEPCAPGVALDLGGRRRGEVGLQARWLGGQ